MKAKLVGVDDIPVQVVKKQYTLVMDEETCAAIMVALDYASDNMDDNEIQNSSIPNIFNHLRVDESKLASTYRELNEAFREKKK